MSQPPPQDPHSPPPPPYQPRVPVYPLDYATPTPNQRSGWQIALRVLLIIFLVFVGLALLAFGLCMAMFSGGFH